MKTTKFRVSLILLLLFFLFQHIAYSQEDRRLYHQGVLAASRGRVDFAFMYLHMLVNDFPESEYLDTALFGVGEYYFSIGHYHGAVQMFTRFINNYPESEAKPFAIAYLLKIAEKEEQESVLDELKKELVGSQQLSLLFRDSKELQYLSPLYKNYRALYFIDKIKIYINDRLFTKISF